jgi:hypothetical protein
VHYAVREESWIGNLNGFYFYLIFVVLGFELMLAKQALYHLSYTSSPWVLFNGSNDSLQESVFHIYSLYRYPWEDSLEKGHFEPSHKMCKMQEIPELWSNIPMVENWGFQPVVFSELGRRSCIHLTADVAILRSYNLRKHSEPQSLGKLLLNCLPHLPRSGN